VLAPPRSLAVASVGGFSRVACSPPHQQTLGANARHEAFQHFARLASLRLTEISAGFILYFLKSCQSILSFDQAFFFLFDGDEFELVFAQ